MKRKKLLGSFAMLSSLSREVGVQKVRDIMAEAENGENPVFMIEVDIGEICHVLFRKWGREKAEYFPDTIPPSL